MILLIKIFRQGSSSTVFKFFNFFGGWLIPATFYSQNQSKGSSSGSSESSADSRIIYLSIISPRMGIARSTSSERGF